MAKTSPRQRKTVGRVMHEYKHGELKRGRGGKVRSRRQAVAIALHEAGASKYESKRENRHNLRKTKGKESRGETAQQEREGKSHVGARGRKSSSPAMGGRGARHSSSRGRGSSHGSRRSASHSRGHEETRAELYEEAKRRHIPGRSKMSKRQLEHALH
jgi:Family of unknown function (DUF6496)